MGELSYSGASSSTLTKEAAPIIPLGSQAPFISEKPLVTKDELIEGSKMSLSS
jgi:hypothetical protein